MDHGCTGCLGASWPGCGSVGLALGFTLGPDLPHVTLILLEPVDLPLTFLSRQQLDTKGVNRNTRCFLGFQKTCPPIFYWFKQVTWLMPSSLIEEGRLSTGRQCRDVTRGWDAELGMTMGTRAFKADSCSCLLLGSVCGYEMLCRAVPLEVRACIILHQGLSLCPQLINQPKHSRLERGHGARRPRSVSCLSTHSYCFPTRPSQVENRILKPSSNDVFLPKRNFWSILEAVWHSQNNYEREVDKQPKPASWTRHTPKLSLHPRTKRTGTEPLGHFGSQAQGILVQNLFQKVGLFSGKSQRALHSNDKCF